MPTGLMLIKTSALWFQRTESPSGSVKWPFRAIQMGSVAAKMTCKFIHLSIHLTKRTFLTGLCQVCVITQGVFEMRSPLHGADTLPSTSLWPSNLTGTSNAANVYQKEKKTNSKSVEFYQCRWGTHPADALSFSCRWTVMFSSWVPASSASGTGKS